jgi:threonine 3-dehydrogenase
MKALVKKRAEPGLWLEDVPLPSITEDQVLVKVKKTSICGTDVHIYKWDAWAQKTIPIPLVVGHEFMGHVAAVGKNVHHINVGDRISGEGHIVCGICSNCREGHKHLCLHTEGIGVKRHGCFAEYFPLPAENVFVLPETIPDDVCAIFDPYGNAVHAALSFSLVGEDVLITGAGPIGIMAAAVAHKAGARHIVITDRNEYRLDLAKKMGATATVNITNTSVGGIMKELHIDEGFTVAMEMSGHPDGLKTILAHCRPGAKIALLGILPPGCEIDWDLVIFKMLTVKGIYGREIFSTWHKMVSLIESGLQLSPLITHCFDADDYQKAFDVVMSGCSGKVILNWS